MKLIRYIKFSRFKRQLRKVLHKSKKTTFKNDIFDKLISIPIQEFPIQSLLLKPHRFVFIGIGVLENLSLSTPSLDFDLPHCMLVSEATKHFVSKILDAKVDCYEFECLDYGCILQAALDNYEWRTLLYYLVSIKLAESSTTHIKVLGEESRIQVIHEAQEAAHYLDIGHIFANCAHTLRMIQQKELDLLPLVTNTYMSLELVESEKHTKVRLAFTMQGIPFHDQQSEYKQRYYEILHPIILSKEKVVL